MSETEMDYVSVIKLCLIDLLNVNLFGEGKLD